MTWATRITCLRLALVPVFAGLWILFARSGGSGPPDDSLRWTAAIVFLVAALSDAVDGYVARHFNQKSELGAFLDPLTDKLLLLTGISILAFVRVEGVAELPLWFFVLVLLRDLGLAAGIVYLHYHKGAIPIRPDWSGKTATALQMAAVLWILFRAPEGGTIWVVGAAAIFTAWTFGVYLLQARDMIRGAR